MKKHNQNDEKIIHKFSLLSYFLCTSILKKQTIGQEYYNLMFLKVSRNELPSTVEIEALAFAKLILASLSDMKKQRFFSFIFYCVLILQKILSIDYISNKKRFFSVEFCLIGIIFIKTYKNDKLFKWKNNDEVIIQCLDAFLISIMFLKSIFKYILAKTILINDEHATILNKFKTDKKFAIKCCICMEFSINPLFQSCGHIVCCICFKKITLSKISLRMKTTNCPICREDVDNKNILNIYNF
jgi:hypothetical protein